MNHEKVNHEARHGQPLSLDYTSTIGTSKLQKNEYTPQIIMRQKSLKIVPVIMTIKHFGSGVGYSETRAA